MIIFKSSLIHSVSKNEPKDWAFGGKNGTTHTAVMACIGVKGVATITLKAKSAEELTKKMALYPAGKAADVEILEIVPVFKQGDRKAASYEMFA